MYAVSDPVRLSPHAHHPWQIDLRSSLGCSPFVHGCLTYHRVHYLHCYSWLLMSRYLMRAVDLTSGQLGTCRCIVLHHTVQFTRLTVAGIGGPVQLEVQHPLAMLYHCCTLSSSLSKFIGQLAAARPPNIYRPWRLILYTDEVLPGNQLGYKSARKFWAVYWSIYEFGSSVLSDEVVAQYLHTCPLYCDIWFGSGCGLQPLHFCQPLYTQCNTHVCDHCKGFMV